MFCNETLEENSPLALTAHIDTLRDHCATEIRWYSKKAHTAANLLGVGDTLRVDLTQINPTNIGKSVTYYLYTVNTNTDPVTFSDSADYVTITFRQTPVFTVDTTTQLDFVVCPGSEVNLLSQVTCTVPNYNDSLPTLTFAWYKDSTLLSNDTNYTLNASTVCGHKDTFTVKITAVSWSYGCTAEMTRTYTVLAQDTVNPVIAWVDNVGTFDTLGNRLVTLSGCDSSAVPAPYTVAQFLAMTSATDTVATASATSRAYVGTIIDGCSNVDSLTVKDVVTSQNACQTVVTRTYVGVDACDNHSNTITEIFTINNDYKPVITGRIDVNPVRDTACTYDVPSYAVLRNIFDTDTNIKVTYQCTKSAFDTVVFYMNNTNVVADGNLNIFADTDLVTIYAVVTDTCGNHSVKTPVFDIHKPAAMYIAHGSITLDTLELCADVTTNMHFNDAFVMNADRPYTYQWSQISVVGQSIITPDTNNYLEAVVAPEDQLLNTSSHFIMTVTDSLGCVASDTSNAIHFYRLPTAEIISHPGNTGNPINDGDTLCPNYGDFYMMAGPQSASNLPDSVQNYQALGYLWTGAVDAVTHTTNVDFFKMSCENCDSLYTAYLTVTNMKNCSATTSFNIYGVVRSLPVITAISEIEMPLYTGDPTAKCVIKVPDFVSTNSYFNPLTVQDECFSLSEMIFTQDVRPDTLINHDTTVVITITQKQTNPNATPCWTVTHNIHVKMPANTIHISEINAASVGCEPWATTLTPTIVNATGAITYNWSTGVHTETADVVLEDSLHTFTLTVTDLSGCANSMTVSPDVYRKPVSEDFAFVSTPNTYCSDTEFDGTFYINVLNDSTAHINGFVLDSAKYGNTNTVIGTTYTINDTVLNLRDGVYYFTITTSDNCERGFNDTIRRDTTDANAPFVASVLTHNFRCEQPYEGSVAVTPNVENYVYSIESNNHITDGEIITSHATVITPIMFNWLYQDTYRVYVVSPKGCHFITNDVTVNDIRVIPQAPTVTFDTADCTLDNGVMYIANTNPTFTYSVDGVLKPGNNGTLTFTNISVGSHPITILSSGNCVGIFPFEMPSRTAVPSQPTLTIHNNEYCDYMFGGVHGQNGSVTVPANQVMAGYTYTFNGETVTGVAGTAVVFDSLADNTYSMTIKDVHSCGITFNVIVPHTQHVFDTVKAVYTNGSDCAHADNKVQITNPNNAYNYFLARCAQDPVSGWGWFIDRDNDIFTAPNYTLDSLVDGYYMVVQEHKVFECTYALPYEYLHVVAPVYHITATHVDDQDCSALGTGTITITNPDANFTYSLNGVDTTVFTGLNGSNSGITYQILAFNNVTSCNYDTTITIKMNSYIPSIDTVVSTPNFYCTNEKNGTITVTLDSVVAGTYYLLDAMANEIDSNTTGVFTGVNSGDYGVYFVSAYHCESNLELINVKDSAFFTAEFLVTPNYTCAPTLNVPGTGCIYVINPHNVAPNNNYTYSIYQQNYIYSNSIDNTTYKWCSLAAGEFHVTIVDTVTGCSVDTNLIVTDSTVHVTLDVASEDNSVCVGTGNGYITVTATADNLDAVLVFAVLDGTSIDTVWKANGDTVRNLGAGNYEIVVRDNYFNCLHDTCSNKDVTISTVENVLNIDTTLFANNACDSLLWNGSIVINSVEYADGTPVDYSHTIKNFDRSDVDYVDTLSNGWGHLNNDRYLLTIHDNTTGCDTILNVLIPGNNSCSNNTTISVTAVNNNTNASNSAKEFYFCYNVENAKLIANATSPCDADFNYTWSRECKDTIVHNAEYDVNTAATICCKYYITAVGVTTGCSKTDTVNVCVDELPSIQFYATGANIAYVGANPTVTFSNCENYAYTFGINNPAPKFDSISWTNGYVATNIDNFNVDAYSRPIGKTSYCVWVMDKNGCANTSEANVMIKAISTTTMDTSSCGTFHYVAQNGHVTDSSYNASFAYPFTVIDTFPAVNGCDSIVTYRVTINANPTITNTAASTAALATAYCHGNTLPTTFGVTFNNVAATDKGYCLSDKDPHIFTAIKTNIRTATPFDPATALSFNMSGKKVYAYAFNDCDTVIASLGALIVDSLPVVSGVTAASNPINFCKGSLCPGTELVASTTAWNNDGLHTPQTEKWLVSASQTDFSAATEIVTFTTADSGKYVTFAATNHCGTTYATPVKVLVDSVADPILALNTTTFCAGDAINLSNITITHTATSTPEDTIYYYGGSVYTLGTALAKTTTPQEFYASVKYSCGSYVNSNKVNVTVNDTAKLVVPTTTDTLCLHATAYSFDVTTNPTNTVSASSNHTDTATVAVTGNTVTVTPVGVGTVTITVTSTAAGCGSKSKDVTFVIADTATNFGTVADVEVCAGNTLTLTAPSYKANGKVYSEGWLLGGTAFNPATYHVQYPADSGKTLTYFVETKCGIGHSNDAILHVKDTADLSLAHAVYDTLCVGAIATINDVKIHASNTLTYTASPAGMVTLTKTGNEKGSGATITITVTNLIGDGLDTVTITSTGLCGEPKSIRIPFVVSDKRVVANISTPAPVCEGEPLVLPTVPSTTGNANIYSQGWEVKKTSASDFSAFNAADFLANAATYKNAELRYMVLTRCGESYSDTVNITVNDTAVLAVTERTQVVCNNTDITAMAITRNKPVELSADLKTAGLGFNTDSTQVTGTVAIPTTATFPYTLTGKIYTTDVECPDKNDTLDIKITVNNKPVVDLTKTIDTVCTGTPITITSLAIDTNHTAGLDAVSGYKIKKNGESTYSDWDITSNVDVTYDKATLIYAAKNGCGVDTSDFFTIYVAGHSTVTIDASMFRDTCSGNVFSDFLIGDPTVTLSGSAVAQDTTWYVVEGSTYTAITDASTINNPTSVACVVTNQCFSDTSNVVALGFDGVPTITPDPLTVAPICEGDLFTVPTFTVADNGGLIADTLWFINGTALDFTSIYDAATYNGKEIKLIVNNACGADTATGTATINVRPVPFMLADTVLCADPLNEFTLDVPNGPFVTYAWKDENGDPVSSNKTETIQLNTLAVDTVLKYYVVVTDANGCESQSRINRSTYVSDVIPQDTIFTDFIHVRVTTKPFFKFTNMDGVPTHDINSSLSNTTTAFKWTLDDKCYSVANQKVYVKFSIYHNGVLIPESEISNYLATATTTVGMTSYNWNTNQVAQYQAGVAQTAYSFYEHISNNFPNFYISSYKYDWVYLPFIASRYVTNTFAQFQQEGNYEIHYDLYATNGDQFGNVYDDYPAGATDIIGGHGITTSTLLASDVFTIHVGNGSTVAENEAPAMPEPEVIAEDPTVKVYPNPTSENVNVRIEGIDGQTMIRISTLTGKTVAQRNVNINNKFAIEQFNVSDLTPGVYVLQIVNEEAVISRKLVITK